MSANGTQETRLSRPGGDANWGTAEIAGGVGLPRPPAADQSRTSTCQKPSARHRRSQVRAPSQGYAHEVEAQPSFQDGAHLRAPSMRPTSSFLPFGDV